MTTITRIIGLALIAVAIVGTAQAETSETRLAALDAMSMRVMGVGVDECDPSNPVQKQHFLKWYSAAILFKLTSLPLIDQCGLAFAIGTADDSPACQSFFKAYAAKVETTAAEQTRRAAIRAQRPGPKEIPIR